MGKWEEQTALKSDQFFMVNGLLRPIWRFVFAVVMIVFAQLLVGLILGMTAEIFAGQLPHLLFWASCLTLLALLAIFKILTGFFEGKPLGSIGLTFRGRWKTELGIGLTTGAAMILSVAALEWGLGQAQFAWNSIPARAVLAGGAYYGLLFAVAATSEEMIFRGYAFQRLIDAIGPAPAVAAASISFGLVHLGNPSHTWLSTFNTVLIGIPLAVAYLRTRALWLPIGMHFAWNFLQGYALGFEVSGLRFSRTLLRTGVHGVPWLTGGDYGPEGSLLASAVIVIATVYLLFSPSIYITEEMRELALEAPRGNQTRDAASSMTTVNTARASLPGGN